ncbi:MAG: M14 family zinc carboxypeptidase, partial [Planctomycetaceae bacterium]
DPRPDWTCTRPIDSDNTVGATMFETRIAPPGTPLVLVLCLLLLVCLGMTLATQSTSVNPRGIAQSRWHLLKQAAGRGTHSAIHGVRPQQTTIPQPHAQHAASHRRHLAQSQPALLELPPATAENALGQPFGLQFISEEQVGQSVGGIPIRQIRIGNGDYVILMLAAIHGNESAGTPLLNRLAQYLQDQPEVVSDCTVILMPEVNPDGVQDNARWNAQGVDLNRNFPAENRTNSRRYGMHALSEPESLTIFQVISHWLPHHIITLHEPLQCVDYDGPAAGLAEDMSSRCGLPVKKLGSRPGSLGSYAGLSLGIPIVTFELPRAARDQTSQQLWEKYGSALVTAVEHRCQTGSQWDPADADTGASRTEAQR